MADCENLDVEDGVASDLSFRAVEPVDVRVRNLAVEVPSTRSLRSYFGKDGQRNASKTILDGIDADMPAGSLTAIIGGSGSGKTSLLNVMARRVGTKKLKVSGTTTFNGAEDMNTFRAAYVMQQDVLVPSLTVKETLTYSAELRLPPPATKAERQVVVDRVILELGLKECADTPIGSSAHKGCSGGEKRRTSIGVQLLANPSVLFCDEPTTGLDANSALQNMRTLKTLAQHGRTVIVSIHAPRSEIWNLFDRVILLSHGSSLYSGPASKSLEHFQECGFEIPPFVNPAEFLIDLSAIDNRTKEAEATSYARVNRLRALWRQKFGHFGDSEKSIDNEGSQSSSLSHIKGDMFRSFANDAKSSRWAIHLFLRQLRVLISREFTITWRDKMGCFGSIFESIGMGVISGWIFYQVDESESGIRSREGALYTASALQSYLILLFETYRLTIDIRLFDRERNEGIVGVKAFLSSRRIARFWLEDLPVPLMFSLITYFMIGYRVNAAQFLIYFCVVLLNQYIAVSLAMVCVSVSREFAVASLIGNLSFTLQSMCSGFFIQADQMPVYTRWLKWIAYCFYSFGSLAANEFIGVNGSELGHFYDCPYSKDPRDPACEAYTGRYIMESLDLPHDWIWRPIVILISYAFFFYILSALILKFWRVEIDVAPARKSETDLSAGKEKILSKKEVQRVDIELDRYSLTIYKRDYVPWKKSRDISILKPITATFASGKLNVIMGPSGSGKTSLLNSMANRLHGTMMTKYASGGNILYNGTVPTPDVIRSVSSFVTQDDDALMPSLTVRETLRFAAGLRLPSWMSTEEKEQRAEDILLKMGLKDCADNIIGNDLKKGISGGEKRRVSIAIQILTDPKVLLLDEPTSGLDAFTATSIVDVLYNLAAEGRTLILTIHQARSDLFSRFENILLLARGGYSVYAGRGVDMLPYFQNLGYPCPSTTNPSDFVLDLISIDLQHSIAEASSCEKVQRLIDAWADTPQQLPVRRSADIASPEDLGALKRKMNALRVTYPLVLRRSLINIIRQPDLVLARVMQPIGLGIILALFFAPLSYDYSSVQSRMGLIQQYSSLYFVGMLQNLAVYPTERDLFYQEEEDGCYSVETFVLSYTALEAPLQIATSLVFAVLVAIVCNLKRTVEFVFISAFNAFCIISCGESIGIAFCTVINHIGFSVNVTSILLSISTIMGGILSLNVPDVLQALNHLSPVKYSTANLASYAMSNVQFTCTEAERLASGVCPVSSGSQALKLYNLLQANASIDVLALGICTVVYRVVAFAIIKAKRMHCDIGEMRIGRSN